ncbi:glycosyltransferase family 39 protein [Bacteroidota bacterium]
MKMIFDIIISLKHATSKFIVIFGFILLTIFIIYFFKSINSFKEILREIRRKTFILLVAIFIFGLILRIFIVPHYHMWYTDEHNNIEKAKTIITGEEYSQLQYRHPIGWPIILTIPIITLGLQSNVAINFSSIIGALIIFNIFFVSYLLTKNQKISLYSSFMFSLIPTALIYSGNAMNNTSSLFFVSLSIALMLLYYRQKKHDINVLALVSIGLATLHRVENGYLFILYFVGIYLWNEKSIKLSKSIKPLLLVILLILPNLFTNMSLYLDDNLST